jgi:NDP-sugar pyrophosphorylase family protein
VVGYPIREYWLDIGQMEDYQRANADLREGRV